MKTLLVVSFLSLIIGFSGCTHTGSVSIVDDPSPKLTEVANHLGTVAKDIKDNTSKINENTRTIDKNSTNEIIRKQTEDIRGLTTKIDSQADQIANDETTINAQVLNVKDLEDKLNKIQQDLQNFKDQQPAVIKKAVDSATAPIIKERDDFKSKYEKSQETSSKLLNNLAALIAILGLLVAGVGIYLSIGSPGPSSLGLIGAGLFLSTCSVAIIKDQVWIGLVGAALMILVSSVLIIKSFMNKNKTIDTTKTALTQVVQTTEAAKQQLQAVAPAQATQLFGSGAVPGHADIIQSPATKNLVSAIREDSGFAT